MKVKIGEQIFDSEVQPVMVILSEEDKKNIATMGDAAKYCGYPDDWAVEDIVDFMKTEQS